MSNLQQRPNYRCGFCGEGVACEHGYCNVCQRCIDCALDDVDAEAKTAPTIEQRDAWKRLGRRLSRHANEGEIG